MLALHFDQQGRGARFADLAASLGSCRVLEVQPGAADFGIDPAGYLGPWLAELVARHTRVDAIVGFCAGACLSGCLDEGVREAGLGEPDLVVIDPLEVSPGVLAEEFEENVGGLAAHLDDAELDRARRSAEAARAAGAVTGQVATALAGAYLEACTAACARLGVADALRDQLAGTFSAYMSYLLACARCTGALDPARTTVILSGGYPVPPGCTGPVERIGVPTARLLADPSVALRIARLPGLQ